MASITTDLLRASPVLARFDPLDRIICHADFNRGYRGFIETIGNYEGSLDTILPGRNFRAPQP